MFYFKLYISLLYLIYKIINNINNIKMENKEKMEDVLIEWFGCGNDNEYVKGEYVECLWENEEYNDRDNYDDEFVDEWIDLKNRLRNGKIVNDKWYDEMNFELRGEDILMWFISKG